MPGKLGNLSDRKMKPPIYDVWSGFGLSQIEQKRTEPGSDTVNSTSTFLDHERSKLNHVDDQYNHTFYEHTTSGKPIIGKSKGDARDGSRPRSKSFHFTAVFKENLPK